MGAGFLTPLNLSVLTCKLKGTVTRCKVARAQVRHVKFIELDLSTRLLVALEMTSQPLSPSAFLPQGAVPFLVSATSGTTVLGAFDPLEAVADVCQRHGLWLHVDVSGAQA